MTSQARPAPVRILALLLGVVLFSSAALGAEGLFYREVERDGRLFVFGTAGAFQGFAESGEMGHGISRAGYGEGGQTVVFESEEAINLYNFKHGIPGEVFPAKAKEAAKAHDDYAVKLGTTIFTDFTYQAEPRVRDAAKNDVHPSQFEVRRAYINVTGTISDWVAFRVTPDIASRFAETVTVQAPPGTAPPQVGVATNFDGSAVLRLKYAFGQLNLDRPLRSKGSWLRIGQQQTPYVDFMEGIYRYRFQGTIFAEREGYLSSSDVGLSSRYALPRGYGDVHLGYYNGDTYTKAETNDQKAFQIRASLRPLPRRAAFKGLRAHAFYDHDAPVRGGSRDRFLATLTYEHDRINLGFDYLDTKDQPIPGQPEVHGRGWSVWATPRSRFGLEGLFRHDALKPNATVDARKSRTIVGAAYWLRDKLPLASAILVDLELVKYDAALARPDEKRFEIKTYFSF
jgi:hypothetical protein